MADRPAVTVICPVHDAADHVRDFIERMARTVRPTDEVIVVDDASADGTADAVAAAIEGRAGFVLVRNDENMGVARARNLAVARASHELLWFADHDDSWEPEVIDVLCAAVDDDVDVVVARADYRTSPDIAGRTVDGFGDPAELDAEGLLRRFLVGRVHGYLWTKLVRRSLLLAHPFPPMSSQSDFVALVRAIPDVRRARTLDRVVYHYINRPGSITRRKRIAFENFGTARDAVLETAASLGLAADDPDLVYFDCWFYRHALAFVPVRQGADAATRRAGMRRARAGIGRVPLIPILRRSRRTGLEMLLISAMPWAYAPIVTGALAAHDRRRERRNARSAA